MLFSLRELLKGLYEAVRTFWHKLKTLALRSHEQARATSPLKTRKAISVGD